MSRKRKIDSAEDPVIRPAGPVPVRTGRVCRCGNAAMQKTDPEAVKERYRQIMKNRTGTIIPAVILCIICIILLSVFARVLLYHGAQYGGDVFIDSETGLPYLEEIDCYYHLRMTRDIALHGHPGDTMKDGVPWDSLSHAPEGRNCSDYKPLMAYAAIAVNRLISIFAPRSLEQTVYWLNVGLSALAVIPVFLLTFDMCGLTGAIAASVLSVLNLGYLYKSVPGFYDTDGVIIGVSCFFFYFGVMLVKAWQEKNKKSLILNGIGFIVSFTALYHSWYIYYIFPGLFVGALILFALFTWKKGNEKSLFSNVPLLLAAGVSAVILILEKDIFSRVKYLFVRIFTGAESSIFPNVFSSINELQSTPLWDGQLSDLFRLRVFTETNTSIINFAGGIIPFLSAFAMWVILIRRIIRKDVRIEYFLLLIWYAVTLTLSFRGWRFIMLFAVPAAILAGNLAGSVCGLMDQRKLRFRNAYRCMILVLLLCPALCGVYDLYRYVCTAYAEADMSDRPVEECLLKIRENTPEDTMLVSWWDYGYFLEEKGRRRTLFDGGTQGRKRTYFISRAFATEDEELSANIFRMLSGSGDQGFDLVFSAFGETEETLFFLDELLSGSKAEAREKLLNKGISEDQTKEITELLFPENLPLTECVITPDMPWFCRWFSVFGRSMKEKSEKPVDFHIKLHQIPISLSESGRTVMDSENGYYVILEKGDSGWYACTSTTEESSDEQPLCVERMILTDRDGYREYVQDHDLPEENPDPDAEEAAQSWTVIVSDNGRESTLSLISSDLADSVFGRLVYLGGAGLRRYQAEPELSNEVLVYRIIV